MGESKLTATFILMHTHLFSYSVALVLYHFSYLHAYEAITIDAWNCLLWLMQR